jgi:hypothetical protein
MIKTWPGGSLSNYQKQFEADHQRTSIKNDLNQVGTECKIFKEAGLTALR